MGQHKNTMAITLAFALLMLCTTGCSAIRKYYYWRPEAGDMETTTNSSCKILFQHGNLNLTVGNFRPDYGSYFIGPPLIPIVPWFLIPPYRKYFYSSVLIYINSPTDTTVVDFSRTQLWYSEGKGLKVRSIEERVSEDPRKGLRTEIPIGRTTIANTKRSYELTFEGIPRSAKELRLDLGDLEVNGHDVKVPVFKWSLITEYHYDPLFSDI